MCQTLSADGPQYGLLRTGRNVTLQEIRCG